MSTTTYDFRGSSPPNRADRGTIRAHQDVLEYHQEGAQIRHTNGMEKEAGKLTR